MKEYVKIRRVGNSLGFTVPAEIVKSENIKENKLIEFSVKNFGNSRKIIKLIL
ncbi:TPA: AbrB/MazE/SpoVT family DNA-binding domain-containing protein [Candidatus Woesearchaeota archaeon]|nr:AbrB/MazE/SpoVT family DNA-binding domain-containing protein [Candidatus Woesearchaeota archaeon]